MSMTQALNSLGRESLIVHSFTSSQLDSDGCSCAFIAFELAERLSVRLTVEHQMRELRPHHFEYHSRPVVRDSVYCCGFGS